MILSALNPIMPTEIGKQVFNAFPSASTSMAPFGGTVTTAGTVATPSPSTAASWESKPRTRFTGAAVVAGFYKSVASAVRSSTPGEGGFMFHMRFAIESNGGSDPMIFGLAPSGAMPGDVTSMVNTIGICLFAGQGSTNLQLYACGGTTGNQAIYDLGSGANRNTYANSVWDFFVYSPVDKLSVNGGDIYWVFMRDGINLVADGVVSGTSAAAISTDVFVGPTAQLNASYSGGSAVLSVMEAYLETY